MARERRVVEGIKGSTHFQGRERTPGSSRERDLAAVQLNAG